MYTINVLDLIQHTEAETLSEVAQCALYLHSSAVGLAFYCFLLIRLVY